MSRPTIAAPLLFAAVAACGAAPLTCAPVLPTLGCFDDSRPRALTNKVDSSLQMTLARCALDCGERGYSLMGVTGHSTPAPPDWSCYCDNSISNASAPAVPTNCNNSCPGGGPGPCGGYMRMSVFNFTCDGPRPPPPGPSLNGTAACTQPETRDLPFCNMSLPFAARAQDLVGRVRLTDIGPQLTARNSPALPYLGLPPYYWGANFVHGITNAVTGGVLCLNASCVTIWPSGPGLGSSFNRTAWRTLGATSANEYRGLNNAQWNAAARPGGMDGLDSWGPTINLLRDPRCETWALHRKRLSIPRHSPTPSPPPTQGAVTRSRRPRTPFSMVSLRRSSCAVCRVTTRSTSRWLQR